MKFKLNEYNNNLSKEELIKDLLNVAQKLNKNYVSRSEYVKHGKYSAQPYLTKFHTWLNALESSGLNTVRDASEFRKISDEELIEDVKCVSEKLRKRTITTTEYQRYGNFRIQTILSRFKNWEEILNISNLESTGFIKSISDNELLTEIEKIWIQLGRQPTTTDVRNGVSIYSLNSYARHFGSWRKALEKFIQYINEPEDSQKIIESNNENIEIIKNKKIKEKNKHKTSRDINLRLRFKVFQRDNFKCKICGKSPANDQKIILHIDHIIPWSKGGETELENLQTLCSNCNLGKSDVN
jgi:hypothetical protein